MSTVALGNKSKSGFGKFSIEIWTLMALSFVVISYISKNPALTLVALVCVPLLYVLLWRISEPPVLFLAVCLQWLQVSMGIFHANYQGLTIQDSALSWTADDAIWLSLAGILVLAGGIRTSLFGMRSYGFEIVEEQVNQISPRRVWMLYLILLFLSFAMKEFIWLIPRLSQFLHHLLSVKWVFFFVLAFVTLMRKEGGQYILAAFLIEVAFGLTGFFAGFLTPFFILGLAYFARDTRLPLRKLMIIIIAFLIVLYLSVVWSAIKSEYRDYVSLGTGTQTVRVPIDERASKLFELYNDMELSDYGHGVEALVNRVAYTKFFSYVLSQVPQNIPHANGNMWGNAVSHIFLPRLLFPDKPRLELDTVITEKYTRLILIIPGGWDTNIPMGYMVESYIDFGKVFMFVPIFLVGMLWGLIYRIFLISGSNLIFRYGACVAILLQAIQFEITTTKLLGGMLMGFIVMLIMINYLFPSIGRYCYGAK